MSQFEPPIQSTSAEISTPARHSNLPAQVALDLSKSVAAATPPRMGATASSVLTAAGTAVDKPREMDNDQAPAAQAVEQPTWQKMRECTVAIRMSSQNAFTANTAYDWLVEMGLDPNQFKPVAAGLVNRNSEFHITFDSKEKALRVVAQSGQECRVKGLQYGSVSLTDSLVYQMRIHWLPLWVTNQEVKDTLETSLQHHVHERAKVRVVKNGTEKTKWGTIQTTYRQAVVTFPLEADPNDTPGTIQIWKGATFTPALISVRGLQPKCLGCQRRGHIKKNCPYPCERCEHQDKLDDTETPEKHLHTKDEHDDWLEDRKRKALFAQQKEVERRIEAENRRIELEQEQIRQRERKLAEHREKQKKQDEAQGDENMDEGDDDITVVPETQLHIVEQSAVTSQDAESATKRQKTGE